MPSLTETHTQSHCHINTEKTQTLTPVAFILERIRWINCIPNIYKEPKPTTIIPVKTSSTEDPTRRCTARHILFRNQKKNGKEKAKNLRPIESYLLHILAHRSPVTSSVVGIIKHCTQMTHTPIQTSNAIMFLFCTVCLYCFPFPILRNFSNHQNYFIIL